MEGRREERRGEREGGRGPPDNHDLVFVEKVQGHFSNLSPRHHHITPSISHCLHMLQEKHLTHTYAPLLPKTVSFPLPVYESRTIPS